MIHVVLGEVHRGAIWDPASLHHPQTATQDMPGPPVPDQTSVPPPANTQHRPRQVKTKKLLKQQTTTKQLKKSNGI